MTTLNVMQQAGSALLRGLTVFVFCCCTTTLLSAADPEDDSLPDQLRWRPTPAPDRIVLSMTESPTTSITVTWRTSVAAEKTIGQLAPASDGPKFSDQIRQVEGSSTLLQTDLGRSRRHEVTFANLDAESEWIYRVGDGDEWSEWSQFRTAAGTGEPFRFVYFGDAQNNIRSMWSRVVRQAFRSAPDAAFFMHAGDLINSANRDAEWGEWFYASGFIHRSVPCVAVPGNHEYAKVADDRRELSAHWRPTFGLPQNGPAGLEEQCYWFDYQSTRFVALNSNTLQQEQAEWLIEVLQQRPQRWTVITFHHPLYSAKEGRDNSELRELWQPIFDRFGVDLVLQGHDHTYARSGLMTAKRTTQQPPVRQSDSGTVYVVSVSGPKMYDLGKRPFMQRSAEDTQLYQVISVDQDRIDFEARTAAGRLYDSFTLTKDAAGQRTLTEHKPQMAERRRPEPPAGE